MSTLLAREGVQVIGIDNGRFAPPVLDNLRDDAQVELVVSSFEEFTRPVDAVFCAWPLPGFDTAVFARNRPKAIILVLDLLEQTAAGEPWKIVNGEPARPTTGTPQSYTAMPPCYELLQFWKVAKPAHYFLDRLELPIVADEPCFRATSCFVRADLLRDLAPSLPDERDDRYWWDQERRVLNAHHTDGRTYRIVQSLDWLGSAAQAQRASGRAEDA